MGKLSSRLWYSLGRFDMVVGIFSLGLATALLTLSSRGSNNRDSELSRGWIASLFSSALSLYCKTRRSSVKKRG